MQSLSNVSAPKLTVRISRLSSEFRIINPIVLGRTGHGGLTTGEGFDAGNKLL
jgi:hypothetical protein